MGVYGAPEDVLSTEAYLAKDLTNAVQGCNWALLDVWLNKKLILLLGMYGMYNKHEPTYKNCNFIASNFVTMHM